MVPNDERGVPVMGVDIVKTKWGWQLCPPGDQFVTGSLERWGVYSEVEVEILKAVAQAGGGGCMVAGGNIGAVAIPLAKAGHKVWTYEPQPMLAKLLHANAALAGVSRMVDVYNAGLGAAESTINVPVIDFACDYNMGRFGKEDWERPAPEGGYAKVPLVDFAKELDDTRAGLVVLDVEGMELELLESVEGKLNYKPYLWVEDDRAAQHKGLMDWMTRNAYTPYWVISPLTPMGMRPDEGPWPMQCSFNLLCVPDGRQKVVEGLRVATVDDPIGNCSADWIVWQIEKG